MYIFFINLLIFKKKNRFFFYKTNYKIKFKNDFLNAPIKFKILSDKMLHLKITSRFLVKTLFTDKNT